MRKVKIEDKLVGDEEPCFIIAEAGSNHNGSLEQAKRLIDVAAEAQADAVKFQLFNAEDLSADKAIQAMFEKIEFKREWAEELNNYAKRKDIIFLATPFDTGAVDLLDSLDVPAFKIASGDLTNLPLIKYIAEKNKPIIQSVGLGSYDEIGDTLEVIYSTGNTNVALLHCIVEYPAKVEDVHLKVIEALKKHFRVPIGFSDHTMEISLPIGAVALGASIIEKHFTISRKLEGPDHPYALEPEELKAMIKGIRTVEAALGSDFKHVSKSEERAIMSARRSIHAKVDISKGASIRADMVKVVRPGNGIEPKYFDQVLNAKAKRTIFKDNSILWDDIER